MLLDGRPAREARARAGLVLQDPESALVMARAGDDVAFGLENRGVAAGRDLAAGRRGAGRRRLPATAGTPPPARCPAASSSGWRWPACWRLRPGLLLLDEPTAQPRPGRRRAGPRGRSRGVLAPTGRHRGDRRAPGRRRSSAWPPARSCSSRAAAWSPTARPPRSSAARGADWRPPACGCRAGIPPYAGPPPPRPGRSWSGAEGVRFRYPAASRDALPPTDSTCGPARALARDRAERRRQVDPGAGCWPGCSRPTGGEVAAPSPRWTRRSRRGRCGAGAAGDLVQPDRHGVPGPGAPVRHRDGARRARARAAAGRRDAARRAAPAPTSCWSGSGLTALAGANPYTLSGGEKRRLSVATAIATAPRVVVADEPTFGQDARTWAELVELLADLRDAGCGLAARHPRRRRWSRPWPTAPVHHDGAGPDERARAAGAGPGRAPLARRQPGGQARPRPASSWSGCC